MNQKFINNNFFKEDMVMKNRIFLIVLIAALFSTSAFALFDPDDDASLKFNLDFEEYSQNSPSSASTVDAEAGLTGYLEDFNTIGFDVFQESGIRGASADFSQLNDTSEGAGEGADCSFSVNPDGNPVFEFGNGIDPPVAGHDQTTFTFWFRAPNISSGTFFTQIWQYDSTYYWEIRVYNGKLGFYHSSNNLRFETVDALNSLGVSVNTWHHAAVLIDRTTRESSKMYIDGLKVPVIVTSYNNVPSLAMDDTSDMYSPLRVGVGTREFDGLLDEIRIYGRALSDLEISLIYQNNPSTPHTTALLPIPGSSDVSIATDVNWVPATGATAQSVYFGTDPNMLNLPLVKTGSSGLNKVTNAELSGSLDFLTTYYWYVKSTISGADVNSPLWSFTTGSQKALNINPLDGAENVVDENINLQWSAPDAASFDVYLSIHKDLVEAGDAAVRIAAGITDSNYLIADSNKGETYYWKINGNYPPSTVSEGDVWQFRTEARPIIVNTSDVNYVYGGIDYPALSLTKDKDLQTTVTGYLGDDDIVIFEFATDPNFTRLYDMIVIPEIDSILEAQYDAAGKRKTSRPMAIHVLGDINLKCHIIASGPDAEAKQFDSSAARAGGHRGSFRQFRDVGGTERDNMTVADMLEIFGPGYGLTGATSGSPTLFCGSGGGYGGIGGDNGRAGGGSGGDIYGYESIPVPIGGSAGGWSNNANGGPGGGVIEIAATGDVNIASSSKIFVTGGSCPSVDYASGGGAGGSVKIVAGGSLKVSGAINANGGKGGDTLRADKQTDAGGGGGGGRVAFLYGTTFNSDGIITVDGGAVGKCNGLPSTSSQAGQAGTIFSSNANPLKPEIPTPADGDSSIVINDEVTLKWHPGFGATQNEVYFGTSSNPAEMSLLMTLNGDPAKGGVLRAEQSLQADVVANQTYYWYVKAIKGASEVDSDIWSFNAVNDFKLVFNTSDVNTVTFDGQSIAPLTCRVKNSTGWVSSPVSTGSVASDGVAVFNFASGFNYNQNYKITVLPEYAVSFDTKPRRPLAIHATGDFYFDGTLDISGDDVIYAADNPMARSGGYRGMRNGDSTEATPGYLEAGHKTQYNRFSVNIDNTRGYWITTSTAPAVFGLGVPKIVGLFNVSGGGGYGGLGGESGRGYFYGMFDGGTAYGGKEVPVPFGGSAGGRGRDTASGAGGGGVEIVATGSVTFGSNAEILAKGGSVFPLARYVGGGGAGGSIKVIAGGAFSNAGTISVNGGDGGDDNDKANGNGGGGSGGRIAIFYATTYSNTGTMTAQGGEKGITRDSTSDATHNGYSIAGDGEDGTIFVSNSSPMKASAPTPNDGDDKVYVGTGSIQLKWYSGYGTSTDEVFFGTNPTSLTKLGATVSATRGEHGSTANATIAAGNTYYFKVITNGTVSSDVWSFKVVGWECPRPDSSISVLGWPAWDSNHDCVVNGDDFWYFAVNWRSIPPYYVDIPDLSIFAEKWLDCQERSNNGCNGW